ncbi:unnamed protein product, partial [Ectocarpus sp. 13 AM-2016]
TTQLSRGAAAPCGCAAGADQLSSQQHTRENPKRALASTQAKIKGQKTMVCPVRPASLFLGVGLVLLSPVECSRARRRHHPTPAAYADSGDNPSLVTPQQGLIREESSIPGVSIWTSRRAAAASASARRRRASSSSADPSSSASLHCYSNAEPAGFAGECQDGRGGIGDADVEPPSRGAREEAREDLGEVK